MQGVAYDSQWFKVQNMVNQSLFKAYITTYALDWISTWNV